MLNISTHYSPLSVMNHFQTIFFFTVYRMVSWVELNIIQNFPEFSHRQQHQQWSDPNTIENCWHFLSAIIRAAWNALKNGMLFNLFFSVSQKIVNHLFLVCRNSVASILTSAAAVVVIRCWTLSFLWDLTQLHTSASQMNPRNTIARGYDHERFRF